jgi:16S rRNA (adenine1518-N6/adenine1519-N6)-dimethyltransferase
MMRSHPPKLGQHFLSDLRYCSRIAEALELRPDDLVIEVGPGRGAVTGLLSSRARYVVAIEIDPQLVDELRQKFRHTPNVEIIPSDILRTDLGEICRRRNFHQCYVFGNLPYYITSPIIHHVFRFAAQVRAMGLLVQREVADRLAARPSSRDYGYLTVFTRLYASAQVAFHIPPGAFSPPPKVQSSFVRFEMQGRGQSVSPEEEQEFLLFLKQSFAYKRKKLLNCLSTKYPRQRIEVEIERLGLPSGVRAEQLSLEQFLAIFSGLR